MGKLILIEGTDCSGKETQSKLLKNKIEKDNKTCVYFSFPNYDSPTGKIVGGPYLGKEEISHSYFSEGAVNVNPKVASLYFAADRLYNLETLKKLLKENDYVILDRYTYSNMAHQGEKEKNKNKRCEIYNFIYELEFNLLNLIKPDLVIEPRKEETSVKNSDEDKPKVNVDVDSIIVNDNVISDDEFFDDFFGDDN